MPARVHLPALVSARTTLAAVLSTLPFLSPFAAPARADATLAASGPYTLTQSLVDAEADYYGWAAGRSLSPAERRRLAALDLARFRRDPAWSLKVLTGEQKTLPFLRTRDAAFQDKLRRIVLADILNVRDNRFTADEAHQVQQIAAGTSVPSAEEAPTPRVEETPATPGMARTAAPPIPAARPAVPLANARLPVHSGRFTLTAAMVGDDLEVWRMVAGRPLSAADRAAVTAVDVDLFRRAPDWLTANLRVTHKNLPALRRADAVVRANLSKVNLVDIFCTPQNQHLSAQDAAQMQAVLGHYIPIVGVDVASKAVITQRDIDAWVAATRFITAQAHVPGPDASYRSNLVQIAQNPARLGPQVEADAAGMERNWAAFHAVWPHLPAAQRARALSVKVAAVKQAAAHKQGFTLAATSALLLAQEQYANYPSALDPRLAMLQRTLLLRMFQRNSQFQSNMMNYNIQTMIQGNVNNARIINGQGIDMSDPHNHMMLPVPGMPWHP